MVEQKAPPHVLVTSGVCMQHASGNCVAPVGKRLDVVAPIFCLCKSMQNGEFFTNCSDSLYTVIDQNVVIVDAIPS